MFSEIFSDLEVSSWWKMRACIATVLRAALVVNPSGYSDECLTRCAVDMADKLLDELGVANPDTVSN